MGAHSVENYSAALLTCYRTSVSVAQPIEHLERCSNPVWCAASLQCGSQEFAISSAKVGGQSSVQMVSKSKL